MNFYVFLPFLKIIEIFVNFFIIEISKLSNISLLLVILIPLITIILLSFLNNEDLIKELSIGIANFLLLVSSFLFITFDSIDSNLQLLFAFPWTLFLNINYIVGIDGISIFFILLTTFLIVICILVSWESIQYRVREFLLLLFLIEFLLINVFLVLDLFLFYIFFEGVLIPMFIMIGVWGSRERKVHAAYQLFFYTLTGSVLMLLAIMWIYSSLGTSYFSNLINCEKFFSFEVSCVLWLCIFIALAVKIPMFPVHIWLPEAHVEAPTAGSVLLAGILLKIGGYGFLRYLIPLFPLTTNYFTPLVYVLALLGIIYSSLTTMRQVDLKKIIAYSSIGHMNFVVLGIFSLTIEGIEGAIALMISHGLVSSGLFICVGILYDRYKTRIIKYYSGMSLVMPAFSLFFFILTLGNIGLPGTSSFPGEILILIGVIKVNLFVGLLGFTGMIFGAVYSIWLYNRIMFGELNHNIKNYEDLVFEIDPQHGIDRETFMLFLFTILVIALGIFPNIILDVLHSSVYRIVELQNYRLKI
jgi:proton-translocating NADH-quinone oxidoreductase chain M